MAQETELQGADMSKEEYISQLYALRAGLSVLSQEKDKAVALQDEAIKDCETIKFEFMDNIELDREREYEFKFEKANADNFGDCTLRETLYPMTDPKTGHPFFNCVINELDFLVIGKTQRRRFESNLQKEIETQNNKQTDYNDSINWLKARLKILQKEYEQKKALAFLSALFFAAGIVGIILGLCLPYEWRNVLLWVSIAVAVIMLIPVVKVGKEVRKVNEASNKVAWNITSKKKEAEQEKPKNEAEIIKLRKIISKINGEIAKAGEYTGKIQAIVNQANAKIAVIQERCEQIYIMLQKEFGKHLDPRDWKYVDLVIFNYETGRAFTRQEALQLVDRETQTDRIVASVDRAAEYIGDCIKAAAIMVTSAISNVSQQLGEMNRSMQGLASGMESVNTRIGALADVQARQLEAANAQNAQIAALVSEISLNNALLAKSNQTSQRLMEDVEYIRYYGTQY